MKIKHFAGYGCVEAKRIQNKSCTLHVRVSGLHERGLRRDDMYDLFNWLVKRFDKSLKDVPYAEFRMMEPRVSIIEWTDTAEPGCKDVCDYYFTYRR